ncbi:fimbrial protein [Cronobacter sakazakii]|nr:fimbrial protein [Cronobacter sakazakii]
MSRVKNKRHAETLLLMILLLISVFYAKQGHAACYALGSPTDYPDLGSLIAQRDLPVGTVIAERQFGVTGIKNGSCDANGGYVYNYYFYAGAKATSIPNVYTTNIPGVGISLQEVGSAYYTLNGTAVHMSGPVDLYDTGQGPIVKVYKIGEITSDKFPYGLVAQQAINNQPILNFYITGGSVTQVACSITTPNLTFPIGDVLASKFGSSVGTIPSGAQNTQNLGLDCDANANINVSLSGIQNPDVSDTSVLALTGQGSSDVASGVGVQLLYNNSPLKLNNRIVLKKSSGGQEMFPLVARYYQTKNAVTTGKANASATLDLTYQ